MFDGNIYEVRQKLGIGNKYNLYAGEGESATLVLEASQKMLQLKEEFLFADPETEEVLYRVKTDSMLDMSGTMYRIIDESTDEVIGAIERQSSGTLRQKWGLYTVTDGEAEQVARVKEDNHIKAFIRRHVISMLPIAFDVVSAKPQMSAEKQEDDEVYAEVRGKFSFRDKYTIELHESNLDPRLVVIGAVVIDAIEGN